MVVGGDWCSSELARVDDQLPSDHLVSQLVAQVGDYAIVALGTDGAIRSWNAGAQLLTGYQPDQVIGRSITMLYTDDEIRAGLPMDLLESARRVGSATSQARRVRADGEGFWANVALTAIRDDAGELVGFGEVTSDITARKQLEAAQASFLATIAHDFRTPIAAMKGFTELVRDAPDHQRDDFLRRIDANADRLLQMMEDLVGYATVRAVATESRPATFDLAALARDTVATMGSADDLLRVVLPSTSAPVRVDRSSMERIIANLVGNALKYAPTGPISVDVSSGDDRVRLSVADQGRGIDADDLPHIFDEFQRGRLAAPDGGTGLGLTSVRQLIEEQGGRVHIQSVVDQGTVVTVELPTPDSGFGSGYADDPAAATA